MIHLTGDCISCGQCVEVCPQGVFEACKKPGGGYTGYAPVNADRCVGCGECVDACLAGVLSLEPTE